MLDPDFSDTRVVSFEGPDELFLDSGRNALRLALEVYSTCCRRRLTVGMQSFNCSVVLDAALRAGCDVVLYDVGLEDCSIPVDSLRNSKAEPDVLLLTHYQGFPTCSMLQSSNTADDGRSF